MLDGISVLMGADGFHVVVLSVDMTSVIVLDPFSFPPTSWRVRARHTSRQ